MEWKVGQQVYCLRYGEGEIIHIDRGGSYSVKVEFPDGNYSTYTVEGYCDKGDATPMLYPAKPEITVPKWQPKEGEWCWFWDEIKAETVLGRFSMMSGNRFQCNLCLKWQNCAPFIGELPTHLKEVQP
jgi:hypothetical protein